MKYFLCLKETRPAFDMLHYSRCIFDSFADNDTVFMEEVLTGKPKYEAFRTFVSALILVCRKCI